MTTQLLVHLICYSVQLITHFASGKALGKKCFLSGVVVAQERDEEKPLLAGASDNHSVWGCGPSSSDRSCKCPWEEEGTQEDQALSLIVGYFCSHGRRWWAGWGVELENLVWVLTESPCGGTWIYLQYLPGVHFFHLYNWTTIACLCVKRICQWSRCAGTRGLLVWRPRMSPRLSFTCGFAFGFCKPSLEVSLGSLSLGPHALMLGECGRLHSCPPASLSPISPGLGYTIHEPHFLSLQKRM